MRLQPPFPPFFLRGLGRCRRCGDGGSRGPGGVPRPSAFAAAGRLCRRGRSRVGGVFRRCGGGGFVPGGFRGIAGGLLLRVAGRPLRRLLSGVRIPGGTLCGFGSGVPGRFRLLGAGGTLCGLLRGFPRRGGLAQGIFGSRSLGGDRKSGEFLDVAEILELVLRAERPRRASCPARPVRPMRWT